MTRHSINYSLRVLGSAALGAVVAAAGLAANRWGDAANRRVCDSAPGEFCLTLYPFEGMAAWLLLTLLGFWIGLWALGIRPLALSVLLCSMANVGVQLTWATCMGLAWSWPHSAVNAVGPALLSAALLRGRDRECTGRDST
ncbi:hypothetical protein ACFYYR_14920 [Streptomyces sp. NPDC001922]|uniref:hypothetical protein n=1 Tax=Streptomyces sp. NPDC001922 TaxID=3364624 RepID=UPI003695A51E